MSNYRRILSVVEISNGASHVIGKAALLARLCKATLGVAGVADQSTGGSDSIRDRIASIGDTTRRIEKLAGKADIRDAEVLISERDCHALAALVTSWKPDLLVVCANVPSVLSDWLDAVRHEDRKDIFDILKVEPGRQGTGQRMAAAVAGLLTSPPIREIETVMPSKGS